jgi:hypothetical protein
MSRPTCHPLVPILVILTLALLLPAAGAAAAAKSTALCPPRLPEDGLHQIQPDPKLPPEIRAFFGNWHGRWPSADNPEGVPTILVMEEIVSPDKVMVVLGWGECPVCKAPAGCQRFWAKIGLVQGRQVLYFAYPHGKNYAFTLEGDRLVGGDGTTVLVLRRLGP